MSEVFKQIVISEKDAVLEVVRIELTNEQKEALTTDLKEIPYTTQIVANS